MPAHDPPPDQSIEELIVECLGHAGEHRDAALDHLCAAHPEQAAELRERVSMLDDAGMLEETGATGGTGGSGEREPQQFGAFRLLRQLGRGGMGVVYLAEQPALNRRVAIKLIRGDYLEHPRARERFRREVEAVSGLDHPGICTVYEAGEDGDTPYIAMRYLSGETLSHRLNREREASSEVTGGETSATRSSRSEIFAAVALIEKVARALHYAHQAGVIHRDVKPGNIMITDGEEPVLLDFGLARPEEHTGDSLTVSGDLVGTPAYMAPEQISSGGHTLDRRADVYSLGVTLFEYLTQRLPFHAPTREALYRSILAGGTADASRFNRAIPTDLLVVLATAMEREPHRRYESALAFAEDLLRVRTLQPIAARAPGVVGRAWRWAQREPVKAALVLVLAIAIPSIAGLAGYLLARQLEIETGAEALRLARYDDALTRGLMELDLFGSGAQGHAEALRCFEDALALQPGSIEAQCARALAIYYRGDGEQALAQLRALEHPELRGFKAWLLKTMDRDEEAARLMQDVPPPRTSREYFVAGWSKVLEGDLENKRAGGHGYGDDLGRPHFRAGREFLHRALLTAPRPSLAYHFEFFHATFHLKDRKLVAEAVAACETLWPEHTATLFAILSGLAGTEPERAIAAGKKLVARGVEFENLYLDLVQAYLAADNPGAATETLRQAIAAHPDWTGLYAHLARRHLQAGKLAEAERLCRAAIERNPKDAIGHGTLAQILIDRNKLKDGITHARRALDLAPGVWSGMVNLGIGLSKRGDYDEAIPLLRRVVDFGRQNDWDGDRPEFRVALTELGHTLSLAKHAEEAEEILRETTQLQPPPASAFYQLGLLLQRRGDVESSVEAYQQAVALDPKHPEAHCNLAWQLLAQSYAAKALHHMRIGHELGSARGAGWQNPSAEWVAHMEKAAEMEAKLMPLVDGEDQVADVPTILAAAQLAEKRGRDDDATRLYARAFAVEPARLEQRKPRRRLLASRAAARAADGADLDAARQRELRQQCRRWLQSELTAWRARAARDNRRLLQTTRDELSQWLQESDYAGLRDTAQLAGMPVAEQIEWQRFWADVRSLLAETLTRLDGR